MFDHVQIKVKNLESSKRFYTAALAPLGLSIQYEGGGAVGIGPKDAPALWLGEGESRSAVHIAFSAKSRDAVKAFYEAALPAGGKDNGKPGVRKDYSPTYFAAFVKDPDGNNIEAVCHKEQ